MITRISRPTTDFAVVLIKTQSTGIGEETFKSTLIYPQCTYRGFHSVRIDIVFAIHIYIYIFLYT